jgi:CRISPR/Cas system-associated exonuclease Cas4 (RecB family)
LSEIVRAITEILETRPDIPPNLFFEPYQHTNKIGPHSALACERRIWYEHQPIARAKQTVSAPMIMGSMIHAYILTRLSRTYLGSLRTEVPIAIGDAIVGHADAATDKEVVELKTVASLSYRAYFGPASEHVMQAALYAYALDLPHIHIVYVERETFNYKIWSFRLADHKNMVELEVQRLTRIHHSLETHGFGINRKRVSLNGRPIDLKPGIDKYCNSCPYKQFCLEAE